MDARAIERCAYCQRHVPVTWIDVTPTAPEAWLAACVAVCEACRGDGR